MLVLDLFDEDLVPLDDGYGQRMQLISPLINHAACYMHLVNRV